MSLSDAHKQQPPSCLSKVNPPRCCRVSQWRAAKCLKLAGRGASPTQSARWCLSCGVSPPTCLFSTSGQSGCRGREQVCLKELPPARRVCPPVLTDQTCESASVTQSRIKFSAINISFSGHWFNFLYGNGTGPHVAHLPVFFLNLLFPEDFRPTQAPTHAARTLLCLRQPD